MSEINKEKESTQQNKENVEIDLIFYVTKLYKNKRYILKSMGIAFFISIIIGFSIPKTYQAKAILAPESLQTGNNQLAGMAAMFGLGGMNGQMSVDALNIFKAEKIIKTTPFIIDLMDTRVQTIDNKVDTTIVEYMKTQKHAWWSTVMAMPFKAVNGLIGLFIEKKTKKDQDIDPFRLTLEQERELKAIQRSIKIVADKETRLIEITSTFQDPMVAALMTDTVTRKLQKYITQYRTKKAQKDCDYLEKLCKEKQLEYFAAQNKYARCMDSNQNLVRKSASTERERLQNEMNLAFQIYSQVATQHQLALAKVQETKPIFTVLEPSKVPLRPVAPKKKMIAVAFIFLSFIISSGWVLFGKECYSHFTKKLKEGLSKEG